MFFFDSANARNGLPNSNTFSASRQYLQNKNGVIRVELRQMRYFLAVAEELNFTRAAKRCHVSQPPLSRQIAQLEDELGVRLLTRDPHSVALTDAGRVFLEDVYAILERVDRSKQRAVRAASGLTGQLVVGFGSSTAYVLLPMLVKRFRAHYPHVQLVLRSMPVIEQIEALRDGQIKVGVVRLPVYDELIQTQFVHREGLVVALPAEHPLAAHDRVPVGALAGCDFVAYQRSRGMGFHSDLIALCRGAGFEPRIVQETAPTEGIIGVVACGDVVAIVPEAARRLRVDGVVYRPLALPPGPAAASMVVDFAVAWLREAVGPTTAGFIEIAKQVAAERRQDDTVRVSSVF